MSPATDDPLDVVRHYHQRTKHRPERYAASLGYLDWATQPDPFRRFDGAPTIDLPRPPARPRPSYDSLFATAPAPAALDADTVGRLLLHSLALSAWKQVGPGQSWSLRINPSSGALHPTEGYLISGPVPGLIDAPGVFHYAPFTHQLERRATLSDAQWTALSTDLAPACLLMGLTSIHWREAWKYGERAWRYCQHDVGHAIGAIAFSARTLGWQARVIDTVPHADLARLLGTDRQTGPEAEHADCLILLRPAGSVTPAPGAAAWPLRIPSLDLLGTPNTLSRDHHPWPVIDTITAAVATPGPAPDTPATTTRADTSPDRGHSAEQIIRQRRSAVDMDGRSPIDRDTFYRLLARTLPVAFVADALPWAPRVSLALMVHRVTDLSPGFYLLVREPAHEASLRKSLSDQFVWETSEGCPPDLPLFRLIDDDARRAAQTVSCQQAIASDGAFAVGLLAQFDAALAAGGARAYPRLFWETGLIGQVLYLEAEAAGLRGTGIGCFFDDMMHALMGLTDTTWQSLYHFTVGGPVEDTRLQTLPPYAHLDGR